jgi:GNAT superfamily N-acetyltransferase
VTSTARIDQLEQPDIGKVASLIATAFAQSVELTHWLVPDDAVERTRCLQQQFAVQIDHAHSFRRIQGIHDNGRLIAAAVWFSQPGIDPLPAPPDYTTRLREITGEHYPRFRALDDVFAAHTPPLRHDHLAVLGVDPDYQNLGLGGLLLTRYLTWVDHHAGYRPMLYLEASSERAARLYARHGFQRQQPVEVPGSGGLHIYPMRRHPAPLAVR